jgi:hypothetical protein
MEEDRDSNKSEIDRQIEEVERQAFRLYSVEKELKRRRRSVVWLWKRFYEKRRRADSRPGEIEEKEDWEDDSWRRRSPWMAIVAAILLALFLLAVLR